MVPVTSIQDRVHMLFMNLSLSKCHRVNWFEVLTNRPDWRFFSQQKHTTSFIHFRNFNVRPKGKIDPKVTPQFLHKKTSGMFKGPFWLSPVWLGSLWMGPVDELGLLLSRSLVSQVLAEMILRGTHLKLPKILEPSRLTRWGCGR